MPATEILDVIRYFGTRKKIFNVHFRNIRGKREDFQEVYPDEGDVDMFQPVKAYNQPAYTDVLMPNHLPRHPPGPRLRLGLHPSPPPRGPVAESKGPGRVACRSSRRTRTPIVTNRVVASRLPANRRAKPIATNRPVLLIFDSNASGATERALGAFGFLRCDRSAFRGPPLLGKDGGPRP